MRDLVAFYLLLIMLIREYIAHRGVLETFLGPAPSNEGIQLSKFLFMGDEMTLKKLMLKDFH